MNLIEDAKKQLTEIILKAYDKAAADGLIPGGEPLPCSVEIPRDTSNGDYATTFAMTAAKQLHKSPRDIASAILASLDLSGSYFTDPTIAGLGFMNFRLSDKWYGDVLSAALLPDYGRIGEGAGKSVMVEFVSANPTGPMTIGNARGGVLGDTIASVLDYAGYKVHREFYLNDAGNQVDMFGKSLYARYLQQTQGEDACEFPENGYHGDYIREIAAEFTERYADELPSLSADEIISRLTRYGLDRNVAQMKIDLERYGIHYDTWFPESQLHESGYVKETMDLLDRNGYLYEKDGAVWFRGTDLGMEKDEVMVKSNGFYTYYAVDIAYHRNKLEKRGFDRVIDVLGADHHGHTLRFRAGLTALGIEASRLDFLLLQLVCLKLDGEIVRVSKRTGKAITLADLLDEIPRDAVRFLFNLQKPNTHLDFDMGLAVKQTNDNPVYYVQYAHARICSLLENLASDGDLPPAPETIDPSLLSSDEERSLIKTISELPEEIRLAARDIDPSHINRYLISLAAAFHRFYNACRIRGESDEIRAARLLLASATRSVLQKGLTIVGVSSPEKM